MSRLNTHTNRAGAFRLMAVALLIGTALGSCKKTEIVPYEREAKNHITAFQLTNVEGSINGVIDDVDNSITVYLPYYVNVSFIIPRIALEETAKLIDASGNEIDVREDMLPVHIDSTNYKYRVKDTRNVIRTYSLVTKIIPFKDPLKLGYAVYTDPNGNVVPYTEAETEALANATIKVYGNFESSSKNGKAILIRNSNNAVVPNGLKIIDVTRNQWYHSMDLQISPDIDSGYYHMIIDHQGRKDTLPTIHVIYKKPQFQWLTKTWAIGDTVTLNVVANGGVNTGIKRVFMQFAAVHYNFPGAYVPAGFPSSLMDTPIELEITSQNRTQVKFKFPNIPTGLYSQYIAGGPGTVTASGCGLYFDFNSAAWGNGQISSSAPYLMEVLPKR